MLRPGATSARRPGTARSPIGGRTGGHRYRRRRRRFKTGGGGELATLPKPSLAGDDVPRDGDRRSCADRIHACISVLDVDDHVVVLQPASSAQGLRLASRASLEPKDLMAAQTEDYSQISSLYAISFSFFFVLICDSLLAIRGQSN
jgi:hypothetical protein